MERIVKKYMILRYIYTDTLYDVVNPMNINLGGPYKFIYDSTSFTLEVKANTDYVDSLYSSYNNILDISAVLGKNSTGKTTILKVINRIFSNDNININYIVIFQDKYGWYIFRNINISSFNGENFNILINKNIDHSKICDNLSNSYKIVYFSNVFDKSTPMIQDRNLIDISTNYLLTKFLKSYKSKSKKIDRWNPIETFKEKESYKKIEYIMTMYNEFHDVKSEELLFGFPDSIKISFSDDSDKKALLLSDIKDVDEIYYKKMIELDKIIFSNFDREDIDDKKQYIFEFTLLLSYELLSKLCLDNTYNAILGIEYIKDTLEKKEILLIEDIVEAIENNISVEPELLEETIDENKSLDDNDIDEILFTRSINLFKELKTYFDREYIINCISGGLSTTEYKENINTIIDELHSSITEFEEGIYETVKDKLIEIVNYYTDLDIDFEYIDIIDDMIIDSKDIMEEYIEEITELINIIIEYLSHINKLVESDYYENDYKSYSVSYVMETKHMNIFDIGIKVVKQLQIMLDKCDSDIIKNEDIPELTISIKNEIFLTFMNLFNELSVVSFFIVVDHIDLSTGHNAYLDMCVRLNSVRNRLGGNIENTILLLIDEGELFLHPEMQLKYVDNLLLILNKLFSNKKVQIIFTSNSPFIVSDIQNTNILYLLDDENSFPSCESGMYSKTFGADINYLLINSFILNDGLIGSYSKKKINDIIKKLNEYRENKGYPVDNSSLKDIKKTINIIGDPIIQSKLDLMYRDITCRTTDEKITYHEMELQRLKKYIGSKMNDKY